MSKHKLVLINELVTFDTVKQISIIQYSIMIVLVLYEILLSKESLGGHLELCQKPIIDRYCKWAQLVEYSQNYYAVFYDDYFDFYDIVASEDSNHLGSHL